MTISEIEAAALNLDTDLRAALAEKLLRSLEDLSQEEIDRLWVEEALRRDPGAHPADGHGRAVPQPRLLVLLAHRGGQGLLHPLPAQGLDGVVQGRNAQGSFP